MRRTILALCLFLVACTGPSSFADKVKQVQDKAVELCSYLPSAGSVVAILSAGNPAVVEASAVANAICTAVIQWKDHQTQALTSECPKVNGVCVQGQFVQKGQ